MCSSIHLRCLSIAEKDGIGDSGVPNEMAWIADCSPALYETSSAARPLTMTLCSVPVGDNVNVEVVMSDYVVIKLLLLFQKCTFMLLLVHFKGRPIRTTVLRLFVWKMWEWQRIHNDPRDMGWLAYIFARLTNWAAF
jgi:hypothetical protein